MSFSPDGRSLLYASERGQSWKIYRTALTDKDEPNFFNATAFKETTVVEGTAEEFQPSFSPDASEIAYLEDRTTLKVLNLKTRKSRVVLPAIGTIPTPTAIRRTSGRPTAAGWRCSS